MNPEDTQPREETAGPILKWPDMTATERHINRSIRFRREILRWLAFNVGQPFEDLQDMANQAANQAGCASETALRWLRQLAAPGTPFEIVEQPAGWVIRRRPGREQA